MNILIINGPNLNMLGIREPAIYGRTTYSELCDSIRTWAEELGASADIFQSNHEGAIIDRIQAAYSDGTDAIVINPGAYTHYSYAIRDALAILHMPIIEIHISNISSREDFRHTSVISEVCSGLIKGEGTDGYRSALKLAAEQIG